MNRRNLRHFIAAGEKGEVTIPAGPGPERPHTITSENDESDDAESVQERYYYLAHDKNKNDSILERPEDRRELVRIPTCAIFHKFAAGRGVPHSFVGFIRQWPALPQVVVSLRFVGPTVGELLTEVLLEDLPICLRPSSCQGPRRGAL